MLAKYKGLVFCDPDTGESIIDLGSKCNGWFLVGVCADDEDNNEEFTLEIACEFMGETPQRDGVQVIHQNEEESDIGFFREPSPFPNHSYNFFSSRKIL